MASLPSLRHLEPMPVVIKGERMVCLTDPHGFVEDQMVLSPPAFFIAACLDGQRDVAAIQHEFSAAFGGAQAPEAQVLEIVEALDKVGFLATATFERMRAQMENAFRARHTRSAKLAGQAYPSDPEELRLFLDRFFVDDQGGGCLERIQPADARPLRGLVAPHIDFERDGNVYGAAYKRLYASGKPDLVFMFGVAHSGAATPFILTRKHFETPFGTLRTDQEMVTHLERACAWDPYASEIAHRMEHSLEFQAVMLTYLYGAELPVVPVLCAFPESDTDGADEEREGIQLFLEACRKLLHEDKRRITVVAAADLAHVGRRFGDDLDITEAVVADIRARDLEALKHVEALAPDAFFETVMSDGNARNICGLGCIYATLKTLEDAADAAEIIAYDYAPDPIGGVVSFTAIAIP